MLDTVSDAESYDMFFEPLMYTDRILRPYGSESTRPNTGRFSVVCSFFRN